MSRLLDILGSLIGKEVIVIVKGDGEGFGGILRAFDLHLNLGLENAREIGTKDKYPTLLIRGNNVVAVSPA